MPHPQKSLVTAVQRDLVHLGINPKFAEFKGLKKAAETIAARVDEIDDRVADLEKQIADAQR